MRIAVAGGTGWVGKLVVERARAAGHDVVVISRSHGVDLTTGVGLDDALKNVAAVVDVSNIQTVSKRASIRFFRDDHAEPVEGGTTVRGQSPRAAVDCRVSTG